MRPHHPVYTAKDLGKCHIVEQTLDGQAVPIPIEFPNGLAASDFAKAMTLGHRFSVAEDTMGEAVGKVEDGPKS